MFYIDTKLKYVLQQVETYQGVNAIPLFEWSSALQQVSGTVENQIPWKKKKKGNI